MAIDYRKEWKKLHTQYGTAVVLNTKHKGDIELRDLMDNQLQKTINNREKLMQDYVKSKITTDITGGDLLYHDIDIKFRNDFSGNISVSKANFATWCERNRKEGK